MEFQRAKFAEIVYLMPDVVFLQAWCHKTLLLMLKEELSTAYEVFTVSSHLGYPDHYGPLTTLIKKSKFAVVHHEAIPLSSEDRQCLAVTVARADTPQNHIVLVNCALEV